MKKVLITEDDALMAEIYRDNFESEGFSAEVACDGVVAIQRLKENPPDLVLLDLMLPNVNGVEVLKFIRSQDSTQTLPVIVMSNAYAGDLGQQARKAGATKCLAKNACGPKRLVEEVRTTLAAPVAPAPAVNAKTYAPAAPPRAPARVVPAAAPAAPLPAAPPVGVPRPYPTAPPSAAVPPRSFPPAPYTAPTPAPYTAPTPAPYTAPAPVPAPAAFAAPISTNGADNKPKADLSRDVLEQMPQRMAELRQLLQNLGKGDQSSRLPRLLELYRSVHGLAGSAAFAGLTHIAQLSCALETLLKELHAKPQKLNPSSLRTVAQAVDLLTQLSQKADAAQDDTIFAPLILVVDDEPISRETTCTALDQANLRALSLEDPALALKLLEENRFDLVFLDVNMPGLNGFEVCQKLHATGANPNTPVVFVTQLNDFETRTRSTLSGGIDFIAKPVLLIELAVKALTHLLRNREKLTL